MTVVSGGTANKSWDIKPLVADFTFGPWAKGTVNVTGLNETALREAASVLGQGPVCNSLEPYEHIVPCGIQERGVTTLSRLADLPLSVQEVAERLVVRFAEVFDRNPVREDRHVGEERQGSPKAPLA